jgi:hypothetical protein
MNNAFIFVDTHTHTQTHHYTTSYPQQRGVKIWFTLIFKILIDNKIWKHRAFHNVLHDYNYL